MSSTSQSLVNHGLFEDQEMSSQLGFFSFPSQLPSLSFGCNHSLKTLTSISPPSLVADAPPTTLCESTTDDHEKQREYTASHFGPQLLSLPRSSSNLWAWREGNEYKRNDGGDHMGVATMKMKNMKGRRKVREPRFCFKTMSDVDVLDDGYKWRKYGQKVVKNTQHPRSYYRCTHDNCRVKKRVERLAEDPRMVITSYEGRHPHSPSHDDDQDDFQPSSQLNNFFW